MALSLVVAQACARVRDLLATRQFAALEEALLASPERRFPRPLREAEPSTLRAGTKPLLIVTEAEGQVEGGALGQAEGARYALKIAPAPLIAAEEAVWELKRLAGRPAVPARRAVVEVEGRGEVTGLLKPFVELHERPELSTDTSTWTELQRAVMLVEQAWEWFVDNLDTNTSQYALLGPDAVPVNIDWDRAFATDGGSALTRFVKYRRVLPNARTFLYSDFVEGKIDLPFALLAGEATLIRHLPRAEVERVMTAVARERFADAREIESFVARVIERRRVVEYEVADFVRALRRERNRLLLPRRGMRARVVNAATLLWDRWQVLLHRLTRGPLGRAGRHLLKRVRTRRRPA